MVTPSVTRMRGHITSMIADNPTEIIITRLTRTLASGKATSTETVLPAQTVRLYAKNTTSLGRDGDNFRFIRRREVRMLAEYDADLKEQSNDYEDNFSVNGKDYLIKAVNAVDWNGEVVSKQCVLQEKP